MRRLALIFALALLPAAATAQPLNRPAIQRGYLHCQFVQADGEVALLWMKPTSAGFDLFLARRQPTGAFQNPVHVNSTDGDVLYRPHPDSRPAIAATDRGKVGVAWFGKDGGIFAAISADGGRSFAPAVTVDADAQSAGAVLDAAFDATGTFFVTWVDTRGLPSIRLARLDRDARPESTDLTSGADAGVSACARPDLSIQGRDLTVAWRGSDADGYRDVWTVSANANLKARTPERLGPASWQAQECPPSSPVLGREFTWFVDGSSGAPQLMEAASAHVPPHPVTAASVEGPRSPKLVTNSDPGAWMLYLPGAEFGQVLVRESRGWRVLLDEVPWFCTSIALVDGQLLMVGDKENTLWLEAAAVN